MFLATCEKLASGGEEMFQSHRTPYHSIFQSAIIEQGTRATSGSSTHYSEYSTYITLAHMIQYHPGRMQLELITE
jgi:hypothetical protein